jgi:hypothetical protein
MNTNDTISFQITLNYGGHEVVKATILEHKSWITQL